jgi:hypothetical protein
VAVLTEFAAVFLAFLARNGSKENQNRTATVTLMQSNEEISAISIDVSVTLSQ